MRIKQAQMLALMGALGLQAAHGITISGSVGGAPEGASRLNFDDLVVSTAPGTYTTTGPAGSVDVIVTSDARVAQGSGGGFAAPFLSGGNGDGFGAGGTDQANGADATPYLSTGSTGAEADASIELDFSSGPDLQYFGILWGSVDTYNTLSFFDGMTLVDSITGSDVTASPNGNQGVNGTLYVNINTSAPYNRVVATSSSYAFEFDNVAYSEKRLGVPDSGTTALLGLLAFGGLGFLRRFMK